MSSSKTQRIGGGPVRNSPRASATHGTTKAGRADPKGRGRRSAVPEPTPHPGLAGLARRVFGPREDLARGRQAGRAGQPIGSRFVPNRAFKELIKAHVKKGWTNLMSWYDSAWSKFRRALTGATDKGLDSLNRSKKGSEAYNLEVLVVQWATAQFAYSQDPDSTQYDLHGHPIPVLQPKDVGEDASVTWDLYTTEEYLIRIARRCLWSATKPRYLLQRREHPPGAPPAPEDAKAGWGTANMFRALFAVVGDDVPHGGPAPHTMSRDFLHNDIHRVFFHQSGGHAMRYDRTMEEITEMNYMNPGMFSAAPVLPRSGHQRRRLPG